MQRLLLFYALSGALSLGYQVVWMRHFVDRFGSSTFTFVLVVSCFIAGLSAGALASAPVARAVSRATERALRVLVVGDRARVLDGLLQLELGDVIELDAEGEPLAD
jgi:hypothetical protein